MLGVVIAGGDPPPAAIVDDLGAAGVVIAADGGVATARLLGLTPTVVVGDLDSARSHDLDWAAGVGARIVRHHPDKDHTDLELALEEVGAVDRLVVVGVAGGRVDHELGNWAAIAAAGRAVEVRNDGGTTHVVTGELILTDPVGTVVSLQPWGGPAVVSTTGLRWPLHLDELSPFSARGISNLVVNSPARIEVDSGVLFVTRPHPQPPGLSGEERID